MTSKILLDLIDTMVHALMANIFFACIIIRVSQCDDLDAYVIHKLHEYDEPLQQSVRHRNDAIVDRCHHHNLVVLNDPFYEQNLKKKSVKNNILNVKTERMLCETESLKLIHN